MKETVSATGKILIAKEVQTVFDFFANPANDSLWRKEINRSIIQGRLETGVAVLEYSHLSKRAPNHLLELKCTAYDKNKLAVFETETHASFKLISKREVNVVTKGVTEVVYTLDFDPGIVKMALGFGLPEFIVRWKAGKDMKTYLKELKKKLEER